MWLTISFSIRYKLVYLKELEAVLKVSLFRLSFIFRKTGKIADRMFFKQEEIYITVFGLHSNRQWNFLTLEVICSTPNRPPSQPFSGLCLHWTFWARGQCSVWIWVAVGRSSLLPFVPLSVSPFFLFIHLYPTDGFSVSVNLSFLKTTLSFLRTLSITNTKTIAHF